MEAGESETDTSSRKRTESNSDSIDDVLEGWNFVYQVDVHNPDAPSSDGESVEVIDHEHTYYEEQGQLDVENSQLLPKPETPVVPADQEESSIPADQPIALPHEAMFDSSFCWFLFFFVSAILMSDVAFMVVESVLDWNTGVNKYVNQPSFLTDLPVTPKLPIQDYLPSKIAWDKKEEVTVDSVEISGDEVVDVRFDSNNNKHNSDFNEKHQKLPSKIDNHNIGKYFKDLSDVTVSNEAQNKFSQIVLILNALQIGLNDLEDVVNESSELHQVLTVQKETLSNVLTEIQSGVSRSMEKMATNVLDKVQRLERNFEIQWCKLEKAGHKNELKGLFYDCQENEEKYNNYDQRNQFEEKSGKKNRFVKDSYQYEVDRDSTGKEFNRHGSVKKSDVHYDFVKSERHEKNTFDHENKNKPAAHSQSPVQLNPRKDKKPMSVDEINEHENKYKQNKFTENEKHETVDNQMNRDRSAFYNEKYDRPIDQKSGKHENSKEYYGKKSDDEKDKKNSKVEYKRSESEDFKRDDRRKTFENQRTEHEKLDKYEHHTKSKNQQFGNDENVEKFDHVRSEKNGKSNKFDKTAKYDTTKVNDNHKEKYSKWLNQQENSVNDNHYDVKYLQKDQKKIRFSDESIYEKSDGGNNNYRPNDFIKSAAEKIGRYLKEKCDKHKQKTTDLYNKLKEGMKEKMKIPLELFNNMFNKYCSKKNENDNKNADHKEKQLKGEYKRNNHDRTLYFNDKWTAVEDNVGFKVVDTKKVGIGSPLGDKGASGIERSDELHHWTFLNESPFLNNKSNVNGDWFIKAGESRSKARWSHRRSDWLFDRATHRRGGVHSPSHNWFSGRRKNWFFRRAWAREQCRETPDSYWCHPSRDETVTIPSSSVS